MGRLPGVLVSASVVAVSLAGCGGSEATSATTTKTVTVSATPSSAEPSAPAGPNPLGKEVSLGGTGVDLAVTVYAVDQNSVPDAPKPSSPGHWVGADVRLCVKQAPTGDPINASWSSWTVSDAQYGNYEASSLTYNQFPTPQYPVNNPVATGDCARGWVLFPVADGVTITTVKYTPNSSSPPTAWAAS